MREFDDGERLRADLFYADLTGRPPRRRGASPAVASISTGPVPNLSMHAGRLFDGVVQRGMHPGALLAGEVDEEATWETIALPRSTTRPEDLPQGGLVVQRALGEGQLACLRVLGDDVRVHELYAPDGRIRPDVLVLVFRPRTAPKTIGKRVVETAEDSLTNRARRFPSRDKAAIGGRAFMEKIKGEAEPADWAKREDTIVAELIGGNMPDALLRWIKVDLSYSDATRTISGTLEVLPDYLSVGHNDDFVHVPLDAVSAQLVADTFGTMLPTARICHAIYTQTTPKNRINALQRDYYLADASRRVAKRGRAQTSTASYLEHSDAIQARMKALGISLGELVAGHKKDVVLARRLLDEPGQVAFHGFYDSKEFPFEPCYENKDRAPKATCNKDVPTLAHHRRWSDYSQGVRLIHPWMIVNGERKRVADVLAHLDLSYLLSSEGTIVPPRIPKTIRPQRASTAAAEDSGVDEAVPLGGRGHLRHPPLGGDGDNVEARWNVEAATASGSTIDVVVHLHGYGSFATDFLARKAAAAGVDLLDGAGAVGIRASQPTLVLVPRGRQPNDKEARWIFDRLPDPAAFNLLVSAGLAWLCASVLRLPGGSTLARGRLTLMAHSGGGAGVSALLRKGLNPDEVVCFDSTYDSDDAIRSWAEARIASPQAARSGLRVFYRECSGPRRDYPAGRFVVGRDGQPAYEAPGDWKYWKEDKTWHLTSTEVASRRLHEAIKNAVSRVGAPVLAKSFKVERTTVPHGEIPALYSPLLLGDIAASVPKASPPPDASKRPACLANDDWVTNKKARKPGGDDPPPIFGGGAAP